MPPSPLDDQALPTLDRLLNVESMTPVVQEMLDPGAADPVVTVERLQYRPQERAAVHYAVHVGPKRYDVVAVTAREGDSLRKHVRVGRQASATTSQPRLPCRDPLTYDEDLQALIQWFPVDVWIPGLAQPLVNVQAELGRAGVDVPEQGHEPVLLRYKPRRRATLALDGHILKLYAREREFQRARDALRLLPRDTGLSMPRYAGAVEDRYATVQTRVQGVMPRSARDVSQRAGALLARLHATPLRPESPLVTPEVQLARAATTARFLGAIIPEVDSAASRLAATLSETLPPWEPVTCHGDFHADQLLDVGPGPLAVVDTDHLSRAPAGVDIGMFVATALFGDDDDLALVQSLLTGVLEGYGRSSGTERWYVSTCILQCAARPFRHWHPDWRRRCTAMVTTASDVLATPQ